MNKTYHVALSYAGEQREYVSKVASFLKSRNVRCFYDENEEINLWGKNLLEAFEEIFQGEQTYFVVTFTSKEYVAKAFPRAELEYILSKRINQEQEYILPARFDSTKIPGLPSTIKYIDLKDKTPDDFAKIIIKKITEMGIYFDRNTTIHIIEPQKSSKRHDSEVTFTIKDESGCTVSGADIRLINRNGTHRAKKSNQAGQATFLLNANSNVFHTIFVANSNFLACVIDNFRCETDLEIILKKESSIGSMIINSTGYIPGIEGRINPILDSINRTYIHATNISINNNSSQPATFQFGENINLEDCSGKIADIRIHRIINRCAILDYITH